jgi:hypothetical protein
MVLCSLYGFEFLMVNNWQQLNRCVHRRNSPRSTQPATAKAFITSDDRLMDAKLTNRASPITRQMRDMRVTFGEWLCRQFSTGYLLGEGACFGRGPQGGNLDDGVPRYRDRFFRYFSIGLLVFGGRVGVLFVLISGEQC